MTLFKSTALVLAVALPGYALAQTAVVTAPVSTPVYVNLINDDSITARLTEAGYKDIKIVREANKLTIDATKDGTPVNLVYDLTTGALTMVDGAGYATGTAVPGTQTGDAAKSGKTDTSGSTDSTAEPKKDAPATGGTTN